MLTRTLEAQSKPVDHEKSRAEIDPGFELQTLIDDQISTFRPWPRTKVSTP